MRQVRVQGCLPTLVVLLVIAALGAVAVTAGLAVVLVTAGVLVLVAAGRSVRRLLGARPSVRGGGGPGAGVEAVPPGWMDREGGPIVEAGPRDRAGPGGPGPEEEGGAGGGDGRGLPPRD